ncbi:uncharacterized protein LOC108671467 [Hyalella azteca]|uniref:Uncharacterized protein LOC108671467 n=1 Tax=Hyalella azteca TaxID=294128 RepID=A0A8B7NLH8_HYAAZ|nr:uncharacterized protein LOC108671467 [Hyalella azteca]
MMKSVGLVLLLIATFAYSSVEGKPRKCGSSVENAIFENQDLKDALSACKSDPKGSAALAALALTATCRGYNFKVARGDKCDEVVAPYMKCVAGKLGYLKADGSIDGAKILAQYRSYAVARGSICRNEYDFGARHCGTSISNYAFLGRAECLITAMYQYPG